MTKKYQYQFDESIFRDKMQFLINIALKREHDKSGRILVFIVLSSLFGGAFLYFDSDRSGIVIGPLLLLAASIYLIAYVSYLVKTKKYKVDFKKNLELQIDSINSTNGLISLAFSDEDFYYHDDDFEIRIKWNLIHSYLQIDSYLFLIVDSETLTAYAFSTFELSSSEFNEMCEFVSLKLEAHYLTPKKEDKSGANSDILDD